MQRPCARRKPAVSPALKGQGSLNTSVRGEMGQPCCWRARPGPDLMRLCSVDQDSDSVLIRGPQEPMEGFKQVAVGCV